MHTRRRLLESAVLYLFTLPFGDLGGRLRATPLRSGFHLVDGWILTDRDLEALRRHDP